LTAIPCRWANSFERTDELKAQMYKAPDYERIRQRLYSMRESAGDDELWVQQYLELSDKMLNPSSGFVVVTPSTTAVAGKLQSKA